MPLYDEEKRKDRAENLGQLNGLQMVLVSLFPAGINPTTAELEVQFFNTNQLAAIVADIVAVPARMQQIFPIFGGFRVPAGDGEGQVHVTAVAAGGAADTLVLTVEPIGDYSTYTLGVHYANIDPIFSEIAFRFRPGCFTPNCAPDWCPGEPARPAPAIDYLARDFDSFKHTLIAAMIERVPGWQPTSEADLDQVLIELFSAAADELSDYQDRVMNEAYLGTARKRVSLARHARLMDYYIHEGNQASTWLALEIGAGQSGTLPAGLPVWTGAPSPQPSADDQVFLTRGQARVSHILNRIKLYSWAGVIPALPAGAAGADLLAGGGSRGEANFARDLIRNGEIPRLLLQERLDPTTCNAAGRDPNKRQLLTLIAASAESVHDPDPNNPANVNAGTWVVRVSWREPLEHCYCFQTSCPDPPGGAVDDAALFHGNLVLAYHGRPGSLDFLDPDQPLNAETDLHFEPAPGDECTTRDEDCRQAAALVRRGGVVCRLPVDDPPLAYTSTPPGGEVWPKSTLNVSVVLPDKSLQPWNETPSLVTSQEQDTDFIVETDEEGHSMVRFGDGVNGHALPSGSTVRCRYQMGRGADGNVGADTLTNLDTLFDNLVAHARVWNPFDVTDGRSPEPVQEIIRRAPEAYTARQLRAVTLGDYRRRAEEVDGVSRAAARYAWTGSWRTVQVAIDPLGTTSLSAELVGRVSAHLESVRLIGEDLEIRAARYVPLDIQLEVCIKPDYWPEDLRFQLEMEFGNTYTRDGRMGFFHPDRWSFGQELHASEIIARAQAVEGIDHIISVRIKRWDAPTPGTDAILALRANEILRVDNDPDHMERGTITLTLNGGRR
ncbi:putative baseplate assembly protein [Mycolicibacterium iranicum]|uniref:Uncharacterized protein n=1 Tax=Mycolicibacterium iranicum TaxID=912594 RepID=A0A178LT50_MYCIR|nr:putative baseplate assembly protein [Mycolicibacterium iranicum]OAN36785.1 hypothetical protein A4X20_06210 [Mycolicibacterium iranicum]